MARRLAAAGVPLVLVARDEKRLEAARATILVAQPGATVDLYALDVADMAALQSAADEAVRRHGRLAWAIASAGIARPGLFLDQPLHHHQDQMATNYFGSLHLALATAPHMREAGRGHLVFIASGAALYGIYGYAAYGPSKFAVRGLAESLRLELEPFGVVVTLAYPPDTDTPQFHEENRTKPAATRLITEGAGVWPADKVAATILAAAEKGRFAVSSGLGVLVVEKLHSLIGPILRGRQRRLIARAARQNRHGE